MSKMSLGFLSLQTLLHLTINGNYLTFVKKPTFLIVSPQPVGDVTSEDANLAQDLRLQAFFGPCKVPQAQVSMQDHLPNSI